MAKILQFPEPKGEFLISVDLFQEPDGTVLARLRDMPPGLIESIGGEVVDKMQKIALWTQMGAESFAEQADALRDDTSS